MWKRPDFILIAAVGGIFGASLAASGYMLFKAAPSHQIVKPPLPAYNSTELVEGEKDKPPPEVGTVFLPPTEDIAVSHNAVERPPPNVPAVVPVPLVDHRYDGVITPDEVSQIKAPLHLSPEQEPKWRALAAAFREASASQRAWLDTGQELTPGFNEQVLASLVPAALPLIQSLRDDQRKGAVKLARALGYRSVFAMTEAANAAAGPVVKMPKVEPRVAVTPVLPPVATSPVLSVSRYDGLLTPAEINRIKTSLKLRPEQEPYWPPVAAILREMGQQQMAQLDAGQKLDTSMSGDLAQRFYSAASPLLQTLTEGQKSEVRRRARMMGLGAYASYL